MQQKLSQQPVIVMDVCGSNTALPSPTANPSSPQPTPPANPPAPLSTQFNSAEDPSSVAAVLGLGDIAVGVMFVLAITITLN
jgi:hypothetical protein